MKVFVVTMRTNDFGKIIEGDQIFEEPAFGL